MNPLALLKRSLTSGYFNFTSRSGRREYIVFSLSAWLFLLLSVGIGVLLLPDFIAEDAPLTLAQKVFLGLFTLVLFGLIPPTLAVNVRRLHDMGRGEGLYIAVLVLSFIPLLGVLIQLLFTLYLAVAPGQPVPNRWGPPPLER
ncbi:DUF805 domain-containing protein [Deinococcus sp. Marseille-Q6407]|uniref:DUF805 domain-containing protein n=1 Tax=Deinococcus sp. Marseille-Q6407 TaxID=2969223 RepID=UPI0021C246FA|nr:DUF805 domain-containing protein [Deinococcus sp. Marseille-Q6407]